MKLGRGSGIALIVAMCAIVLALFLVPIRTFADEENAAETAVSAAATATPSTADSTETAGSSTDSTSAKTATDTLSESAATDASSSSSASELFAYGISSSATGTGALSNPQGSDANADVVDSAATPSLKATLQVASSTPIAVKSEIVNNISIHYVENGNERIILYCMNNDLAWPDSSEGSSIPYTEGYLTEDYFANTLHKTKEEYEQCMKELEYLLYAGYPYNGMNLYTVTDKGKEITESEFNELLEVPDRLRSDFHEQLGDAVFTYSDYTQDPSDSSTNMYRISQFLQKVYELGATGTTASGMTRAEVFSTDFYKAAYCMSAYYYGGTPLATYDKFYARDGSYVTIAQANDATQNAVWALLTTYGVPDNDIPESIYDSDSLVTKMLAAARAGANLQMAEPDSNSVTVSGDTKFVFDPESGIWRTGWITISEPETYRGVYTLSLPDGLTALSEDGTTTTSVKAGTRFRISSTEKPTEEKNLDLSTTLVWTEGIKQYSPQSGLVAPSGKEYQHMLGEVIHTIKLSKNLTLQPAQDGHLKVSKKVTGEANSTTEFTFKVALDNTNINGTYGGMTFTNGVATVTLKDGEFATAEHLPAGTKYTVTEADSNSYRKSATGETGDIEDEKTAVAAFTNLRLYSLTVEKTVSGTANESSNQKFPIVIKLKNADGDNVSDTFKYTGGVADSGSVDKPADGSLTFANGEATIKLKAGQKIALSGIPSGYSYSVSEDNVTEGVYDDNDANHTSYTVTGTTGTDFCRLDSDASVTITNTVRTGSLTVKKQVTKEVNPTSSFRIKVTLTGAGTGLSGTYGDMTFNDGIATFDLKDNESITATGLPEGTTYTVEENSYDDYTTTYAGNNGTIGVGTDSVVTVTNERKPIALPLTGSDGVGPTYLAGIAVLAAAAVWMHIRRNASVKGGDGRD